MGTNNTLSSDPRSHPDNANLPNINQTATIQGTAITFLLFAVCALSLRLWVRLRDHILGWDDAFVVLAGIASIVGAIMVCMLPEAGLGLHLWTLDEAHLSRYFKYVYVTNSSYSASTTFIKVAILLQYLRLFAETASSTTTARYRLARRLTWTLIVLSAAWGLTFFLLAIFSCSPIAKNWKSTLPGKCIGWGSKDPEEFFAVFLGHAVSNSMLDILVLALPVPFLTMLRLAGKSRVGLITLFALGCIVGVFAIARMIALSIDRVGTVHVVDMSFHTPAVFIFGVLEVTIAIIAASIPIFFPAIATLAANKIFVMNEIEVHVEQASRNNSFDSTRAISLKDRTNSSDRRTSKLGVVTTTFDSVPRKSNEKSSQPKHQHKHSNASSIGRTMGLDFGSRPSQESQRHLYRVPSNENRSSRSLTRSETDDWFREVDKVNAGVQLTTTISGTKVPFEHISGSSNT